MKLWIVGLPLLVAGCKASHVVYVHEQTLGVDVALTTEGTNKLNVGYDRESFAFIPRFQEGANKGKAMSVAAVGRAHIQGLSDIQIEHMVATGAPAIEVAKGAKELAQVAKTILADDGGAEK